MKESLRVQEHLEVCPSCRDTYIAECWVQTVAERSLIRTRAPASLRQRVVSAVSQEAGRKQRWQISLKVTLAGVLGGMIALSLSLGLLTQSRQASSLAQSAVVEHNRYSKNADALPVRGSESVAVAKRLEQHLPFRLGFPPEPVEGVRLLGGTVISVQGTEAAYLLYRVHGTPISLLLTTPRRTPFSNQNTTTFKNILLRATEIENYHTLQWSGHRLTYLLVSNDPETVRYGCIICHGSSRGRQIIAGFFKDL